MTKKSRSSQVGLHVEAHVQHSSNQLNRPYVFCHNTSVAVFDMLQLWERSLAGSIRRPNHWSKEL